MIEMLESAVIALTENALNSLAAGGAGGNMGVTGRGGPFWLYIAGKDRK